MIAANTIPWPSYLNCFSNNTDAVCHLIVGGRDLLIKSNIEYVESLHEKSKVKLTILPELGHAEVYWSSEVIAPLLIKTIKMYNGIDVDVGIMNN